MGKKLRRVRPRAKCTADSCTNYARKGGECVKHGAKLKKCSSDRCTNIARKGGVCKKHGAEVKMCAADECTNQIYQDMVCIKHGAKKKTCAADRCTNKAVKGGICKKHGAEKKKCAADGCTNFARQGGGCVKHGAKLKKCSSEGCTNFARKSGGCVKHGAKLKKCSSEGCTNNAQQGGVCKKHGAEVKMCAADECTNQAQQGGVCIKHGAKLKKCSSEGCTNNAVQGGICKKHGAEVKKCAAGDCTNEAQQGGVCIKHGAVVKKCMGSIEPATEVFAECPYGSYPSGRYSGRCVRCFCQTFPNDPRALNAKAYLHAREQTVREVLQAAFPGRRWTFDRGYAVGVKQRPDARTSTLHEGALQRVIIVEVDEDSHRTYDCGLERARERVFRDHTSISAQIAMVRFNPDAYSEVRFGREQKHPSCFRYSAASGTVRVAPDQKVQWAARCQDLVAVVDYLLDAATVLPPPEEGRASFICELFYDNIREQSDATLEAARKRLRQVASKRQRLID